MSNRFILEADPKIIDHDVRPSIKLDGLPSATCKRVHELCGCDPADDLTKLEQVLAASKFSKPKQALILALYTAEAEARGDDTPAVKRLIGLFVQAGETRAKARGLAEDFDPKLSAYQFQFTNRQSFLKADRFAELYDPDARDRDRPLAIMVRELLGTPHIINKIDDASESVWKEFQKNYKVTATAAERLMQSGIILKVDDYIGLSWLIRAERTIAEHLARNEVVELDPRERAIIEHVLDHAADFLRKPGFVLTDEQRTAILTTFQHRFVIITGPPGVGKTAVEALINAIASMLYADEQFPAWAIALAGRAASNSREAGVCWTSKGGMIPLHATTIHRGLGLQTDDNDGPTAFANKKRIRCGVLIVDEVSMISSPLLAVILKNSDANHIVFVGDADQLPPIGRGKAFRDMIAANMIPTTRLTKNWRTECQGICNLTADMVTESADTLLKRFPEYLTAGGVELVQCGWRDRVAQAAMIVARLVDQGVDVDDIAVLSPHKDGGAGCQDCNANVRDLRKFSPQKIEVGLLMKNPDGDALEQLPEHIAFGYAMSTHKAQGSQFKYVIVIAERGYAKHGVVQGSNIYTATSRAQERVFIIGKLEDFCQAATTAEIQRVTLLEKLLKEGSR